MPSGMIVYGEDGAVQVDTTSAFSLAIAAYGTTYAPNIVDYGYAGRYVDIAYTGVSPILALKVAAPLSAGVLGISKSGNNWVFRVVIAPDGGQPNPGDATAPFQYYIFDRAQPLSDSFGLQVFDQFSVLTFSSETKVMNIQPGNTGPAGATAFVFNGFMYSTSESPTDEQGNVTTIWSTWFQGASIASNGAVTVSTRALGGDIFNGGGAGPTSPGGLAGWGYPSELLVLDVSNIDAGTGSANDYTPAPVAWPDITATTTAATLSQAGATRTLTNFNQTITLRIATSGITSNLSSGSLRVLKNGVQFASIDVYDGVARTADIAVVASDQIQFQVVAATTMGQRSAAFVVTVRNVSDGNLVMNTFDVTATVDSDNDYNIVDVTPSALNWANISIVTNSNAGNATNAALTLAGVNQAITLRATVSGLTGSSATRQLIALKNGSTVATATSVANGTTFTFAASAADTIAFYADGSTASGRNQFAYTVTITNVSDGNAVLDTFTVTGDVDQDNNYNVADPYLDAIDWPNVSVSGNSNQESVGNGYKTISGINQAVTLRYSVTGYSGNFSGGWGVQAYKNYSYVNEANSTGVNRDVSVANGDVVSFVGYGGTASGTNSGTITVTVTNLTTGQTVDTFSFTITADADNNYNVADYVPDAMSFPAMNFNVTSTSGGATGSTKTLTGINQNITLRFAISGVSETMQDGYFYVISGGNSILGQHRYSQSGAGQIDLTFAPNAQFYFYWDGVSFGPRQTASFTVTVYNLSNGGQNIGSFTCSGVVVGP